MTMKMPLYKLFMEQGSHQSRHISEPKSSQMYHYFVSQTMDLVQIV